VAECCVDRLDRQMRAIRSREDRGFCERWIAHWRGREWTDGVRIAHGQWLDYARWQVLDDRQPDERRAWLELVKELEALGC
jgi:hypothetical protein